MTLFDEFADEWVATRRSHGQPVHDFIEKPAMRALLGDLSGKQVLAAGCGSGEETGDLYGAGAAHVTGVDESGKLIQRARQDYPSADFIVGDIADIDLPTASMDVIYCSMVMHFKRDWSWTLGTFRRLLRPGGTVLLSTRHPARTAGEPPHSRPTALAGPGCPPRPEKEVRLGYSRSAQGVAVFGDYLNCWAEADLWYGRPVTVYHRSMSAMINAFVDGGFVLRRLVEPAPLPEAESADPTFWSIFSRIPHVVIFDLGLRVPAD